MEPLGELGRRRDVWNSPEQLHDVTVVRCSKQTSGCNRLSQLIDSEALRALKQVQLFGPPQPVVLLVAQQFFQYRRKVNPHDGPLRVLVSDENGDQGGSMQVQHPCSGIIPGEGYQVRGRSSNSSSFSEIPYRLKYHLSMRYICIDFLC